MASNYCRSVQTQNALPSVRPRIGRRLDAHTSHTFSNHIRTFLTTHKDTQSNTPNGIDWAQVKLKVDNLLVEKQEAEKRYRDKFTTVKERIAYLTDNDHDDVVRTCINADEGRYVSKYIYGHNNDHDLVQYCDYLAHCVEKNKQFYDVNLKKLYARLRQLSNELTCAICLEKLSRDRFISCGCWHKNCDVCLAKHFTTIITEGTVGNISEQIRCPSIGCEKEAPQVLIERVVNADTYRRYEYLALREAIGKEADVCYCPIEQCTWFVEMKCAVGATCGKCGYNFCTRCRKRYHGDCDYDEARERQKVEHEQMSSTTVTKTTKTCPTCLAPIEKNAGCQYIICTKCRNEFCWLCRAKCVGHMHVAPAQCVLAVA